MIRALCNGRVLGLGLALVQCEALPEAECVPCENSCPGDLVCSAELGKCVDPDVPLRCADSNESVTVSGGGGSAGTSSQPSCTSDTSCVPELAIPARLKVDCSAEPLAVPLEAKCACDDEPRTGQWTLVAGPPGLLLENRALVGTPPPGLHTVRTSVSIDDSPAATVDLELEVSECFTFFVEGAAETGRPRVAAARTDTGQVTPLPTPHEDAVFVSFDVAPASDLMAQVFTDAERQRLQVFRMTRGTITELALDYPGDHLAHAFSLDSRWLALVTTDPSNAGGSLLSLIDLENPDEVRDQASVPPSEGLLWSNTGSILRFAQSESWPEQRVVFEHRVQDGQLQGAIELRQTATAGTAPLHALVRTRDGFLVTFRENLVFVGDAREDVRVEHGFAEAFSPEFTWVASGDSPGKRIDYLNEPKPQSPHVRATECDLLRAWSPDDSAIFCTTSTSDGSEALVYPVPSERGVPEATKLNLPNGYEQPTTASQRSRIAISAEGAWLALVPNRDDGLLVLRAEDLGSGLEAPTLPAPSGSYEWDFLFAHEAFTRIPRRLIVQQGRALQVATLAGDEPDLEFTEFEDIELPPVPTCKLAWFPDLDQWCGAPRFAGNLLLSRTERYLTFHDTQNQVYVVDLETLEVTPLGTLASACCPECPEDRAKNCLLTQ